MDQIFNTLVWRIEFNCVRAENFNHIVTNNTVTLLLTNICLNKGDGVVRFNTYLDFLSMDIIIAQTLL